MHGFRYVRVVLKFTSSKGEVGFAEAKNENSFQLGKSGLLESLKYYFVSQESVRTDTFGADKMISESSKEFQLLDKPFAGMN